MRVHDPVPHAHGGLAAGWPSCLAFSTWLLLCAGHPLEPRRDAGPSLQHTGILICCTHRGAFASRLPGLEGVTLVALTARFARMLLLVPAWGCTTSGLPRCSNGVAACDQHWLRAYGCAISRPGVPVCFTSISCRSVLSVLVQVYHAEQKFPFCQLASGPWHGDG
jgi:hypothetical protein